MLVVWTKRFPQFPFQICKVNDRRVGTLVARSPLPCPGNEPFIHNQIQQRDINSDLDMTCWCCFLFPPLTLQCPGGVKLAPSHPLSPISVRLLWLRGDITNAENCQKFRPGGKWHNWYFRWRKNIQFEFYQQECWFKMYPVHPHRCLRSSMRKFNKIKDNIR